MRKLITWLGEWVETWRVAPPFSRRRRELLAAIADPDLVDAPRPTDESGHAAVLTLILGVVFGAAVVAAALLAQGVALDGLGSL